MSEGTSASAVGAERGTASQARRASEQERLAVVEIYHPIEREMVGVEQRLEALMDNAPSSVKPQLLHALKGGGKRLRPALALLAGSFHKGDVDSLICMASSVELLHTATLVHDDTIDNAVDRRARPTVNRLWGNRDAALVGDYLCAASAFMTAQTGNVQAMSIFSRTLSELCRGAISEYAGECHHSRKEYLTTIGGKTAALFRAATECGALLSGAPPRTVKALKDYGYNLGMAFQIVDDIQDVESDLARGILNLPALLLLEGPNGAELRRSLQHDREDGLRLLTREAGNSAVRAECREVARHFHHDACAALHQLPRNAARDSLVALAAYLTERDG